MEEDTPVIPVHVTPVPGSRLEQLVSQYETLKARAAAASDQFKTVTDAIKAEACGAYPQARAITIAGSPHWPGLKLTWSNPWRIDTKRMKAEDPVLYVTYAVRSQQGRWELRQTDGA